jgi:glycosyltransferase involved in cell wall biosynthesis
VGSEIRNPDILMSINPYYAHAYYNGYEYANIESAANSTSIQTLFASYGAIPLMGPEISLFIKRDLFKRCYENIHQRLDLTDYQPNYPSILQNKPLIVHSPTARIAKGSAYILKAIERLRAKYDFEFRLIENMSRMEALKWMKKSDIFIDQLIIGSHGMAATEAMALGKPVLCYIMQEVFEAGLPSDCPIINANPDTIESQLVCLLEDAAWRHHQGRASRSYVETYYDAKVVAANLLNIYRREIVITDPS